MEVSLCDILEAFSISASVPNRIIRSTTELIDLIRMCYRLSELLNDNRLSELLNDIGYLPDEEDDI